MIYAYTRPRYQVSVYRTISPLVYICLQVASRHVFIVAGIIYILFGIFGKFSAIFITIPYPVLGGAIILMWGTFFGVILSNLQVNYNY